MDAVTTKSLQSHFPSWTVEPYVHWSQYVSLYSAKTRSYMIKKRLNFTESAPSADPQRFEPIKEKMGYFGIPVLSLPDGNFISDTTAIIRYLEAKHPDPPMQPQGGVLQAIAWLIFNYGTEGLFLNAQHYRWNFKESADFAAADIGRGLAGQTNLEGIKKFGEGYQEMKLARFPDEVGITPETIPAIEKSNAMLFERLDRHFRCYPYLLGGLPSIADCAMMEVLHAHLGRDVYPADIMKKTAPALYRWTELMNRPVVRDAELSAAKEEYFVDTANLPETLLDFLRLICSDFGPQLAAAATTYEAWLAAELKRPEGTIITVDPAAMNRQAMGKMEYVQQGTTIKRDAWPDVLNMHQYVLEVADAMTSEEKAQWTDLMSSLGGQVFLETRLSRPVVMQKDKPPYAYVLGPNGK